MFDRGFNRFRDAYGRMLEGALHRRVFVLVCAAVLLVVSGGLATVIGLDFFPSADVGLIKLHYRAPRRHPARAHRGTGAAGRGQHPPDHPGG